MERTKPMRTAMKGRPAFPRVQPRTRTKIYGYAAKYRSERDEGKRRISLCVDRKRLTAKRARKLTQDPIQERDVQTEQQDDWLAAEVQKRPDKVLLGLLLPVANDATGLVGGDVMGVDRLGEGLGSSSEDGRGVGLGDLEEEGRVAGEDEEGKDD
jgi:hypothetical protein